MDSNTSEKQKPQPESEQNKKRKINEKIRGIDALFILMQHQSQMFKPEMLKCQILCRSFQSEKSFQNIISKESFGKKKRTIFMHAIKRNNIHKFRYMLNNYTFDINTADFYGQTILSYVCEFGNIDMFKELYKELLKRSVKIDINIRDYFLKSALSYACENGNIEIVKELLNKGAEMDYSKFQKHQEESFISPIYFAIKNNHTDIVKLMIEKGLNTSRIHSNVDEEDPLELAIDNSNVEIAVMLIKSGTNLESWRGIIPFYQACRCSYFEIVQALINRGMRGNCIYDNNRVYYDNPPEDTETALMCASTIDIVRLLVENGGNVNAVTSDGRTALYINCKKGNVDIVSYLIKNGAKINIITHDNQTPLLIACENNNIEIVNLLLLYGADISKIDYNKYSENIKSLFLFNEIVNNDINKDK